MITNFIQAIGSEYPVETVTGKKQTTNRQIVQSDKSTFSNLTEATIPGLLSKNLSNLKNLKTHTVLTYGMKNEDGSSKAWYKRLGQFINNLFCLYKNLKTDRRAILSVMNGVAKTFYSFLGCELNHLNRENLETIPFDEYIGQMEEVLQGVKDNAEENNDADAKEVETQITDIIDRLKCLKLYVAGIKISEQLKESGFFTGAEISDMLKTLDPKNLNDGQNLSNQGGSNYMGS